MRREFDGGGRSIDALTETFQSGATRAAASLSELIGARITLRVPTARRLSLPQLPDEPALFEQFALAAVVQNFHGLVSGRGLLCFPAASGIELARLMARLDIELEAMDIELTGVLTEVGNIVLNDVLSTLAGLLQTRFRYDVPQFSQGSSLRRLLTRSEERFRAECELLNADVCFGVADRDVWGAVMIAFEPGGAERIVQSLQIGQAPAVEVGP